MEIRQVVTEFDWMNAIYDYIGEQLDGRFRLQFPQMLESIDDVLEITCDPFIRTTKESMLLALCNIVASHGSQLTLHSLTGCSSEEPHTFQQELLILIWSARSEATTWLNRQGIVPGQSFN